MKGIRIKGRWAASRRAALVGACVASFGLVASPSVAAPPSIESQSVSNVTTTSATLEATIDPGNLEGGAYYQFQLAVDPAEYWPELTCPAQSTEPEVPCLGPYGTVDGPPPAADIERRPGDLPTVRIAGGSEGVGVSLDLAEAGVVLQPDTTYHYRVLAAESPQTVDSIVWEAPPAYGADQTFVTSAEEEPVAPPVAADESSSPALLASSPPPPAIQLAPKPPPRCQRLSRRARQRIQGNHKVGHPRKHCRKRANRALAHGSVAPPRG